MEASLKMLQEELKNYKDHQDYIEKKINETELDISNVKKRLESGLLSTLDAKNAEEIIEGFTTYLHGKNVEYNDVLNNIDKIKRNLEDLVYNEGVEVDEEFASQMEKF